MNALLGGLSLGEIPIAGSKRKSFGHQIGGQVYRVGGVWANRAFVVVRGNLRLLYVTPRYGNYASVARRVFSKDGRRYDYDHALGRALCRQHGFQYILMTRLDKKANRSHGHFERPVLARDGQRSMFINLEKFCFADERIFYKLLGVPSLGVPAKSRIRGYQLVSQHTREASKPQSRLLRNALGMDSLPIDLAGLGPIDG